jgi:hypothetical protein
MKYTAVFIGGEFDMTKRAVEDDRPTWNFASMPKLSDALLDSNIRPETIETHILDYNLCGRTENNVLIYEFRSG